MIAIIDYGMGNLRSVHKAFEAVGHRAVVTRDPRVIHDATHVVLPGVGAFADCMANLDRYDLIDPIRRAIGTGKPFLGICLGLQVLFTESEEFGVHKGLDVIPGRVKRFRFDGAGNGGTGKSDGSAFKIPHIGWNAVVIEKPAPLFRNIETESFCYFVHSYYVEPDDPAVVASVTDYGLRFASSVWRDNIVACQFHPEKSQAVGLRMVKNFGDWG
ncbi:MAG TPA: imidazole glycerol phosphate synthase subunit HisH [Nitrospiraceae bacterium]|jgi:glutamine amidotransferase|nr:imidazole glycerol phosphate synthase subunit HisH [Nitrospiraceae bacterium]